MKTPLFFFCFILIAPLCAEVKVLALAGSSREGSYNKLLVKEAGELARQLGAQVTLIDLKDFPMPFYDADLEEKEGMPSNAKRLKQLMVNSDVIMIASPEYNATVSAILKNSLDWASRSENEASRSAFKGKKFALMSASPSKKGGARGLVDLQAIIEDVGGEVVKLKTMVPVAYEAFDAQGKLKDQNLRKKLQQEVEQVLQA
ncbi:MAG: NADPH-dependent FMN reductase, partial [Chlamydiales bacterium]